MARLIPNPWLFLEATGQVFRGDGNDVFQSSQRSDLSYVAHVHGYHDLSESTNIDVGTSYAYGHNDAGGVVDDVDLGRFTTSLFGIDATLRWRPLQRSIYHSFLGRGEVIWSRRDQPDRTAERARASTCRETTRSDAAGSRGLRFDRSERPRKRRSTTRVSRFVVTYWPSEFSQVRGQYRRTDYAEGRPRTSSCSSSSSPSARTARIRSEVGEKHRKAERQKAERHEPRIIAFLPSRLVAFLLCA